LPLDGSLVGQNHARLARAQCKYQPSTIPTTNSTAQMCNVTGKWWLPTDWTEPKHSGYLVSREVNASTVQNSQVGIA
jgi:hypothetical protein